MMPPPGLQIQLRPPVTLTFVPLTPNFIVSCLCPGHHLCQFASKSWLRPIVHIHKYHVHKGGKRGTIRQTDERTEHIENIMPPASLDW